MDLITVSSAGIVRLPCIASPVLFMRLSSLLAKLEQTTSPLLPEAFLELLFARLLSTLRELHRCGLTHGDLSPTNVLLTAHGGFSLLQREGGAPPVATCFTSPPRHLAGQPASDLFALGALLFLLVEGREPFWGETEQLLQLEYARGPPELRRAAAYSPGVARLVLQLLSLPEECHAAAMQGRLVGFESSASAPQAGAAGSEAVVTLDEVVAGLSHRSPPRHAASPQARSPVSPPPPPPQPQPQLRQPHSPPQAAAGIPAALPAAAADGKEALRLQRLAKMREAANAASGAGAAAEEALRGARVEAHAARMRMRQQFGAAGVATEASLESAAVLIAQAPTPAPTPAPLPLPMPTGAQGCAGALAAGSGHSNPALDARAARLQAKREEEELALELARRRTFAERQQLASKARTMFAGNEGGLSVQGGSGGSGGGSGGGSRLAVEADFFPMPSPAAALAAAAPYSAAAGLGMVGGQGAEGPSSSLHANLRAERLRRKQEEEEAALEAARKLAFAERMALQKKHGRP